MILLIFFLIYLYGFFGIEQQCLMIQVWLLELSIFGQIDYSGVWCLLEVGSGVGVQIEILLCCFFELYVIGVDLSEMQFVIVCENLVCMLWCSDCYILQQVDVGELLFEVCSFDLVFLCWVLEYVFFFVCVLSEVCCVLVLGLLVYIIEVMNVLFLFDLYLLYIWCYWMVFNDFQYDYGGDLFVGVKLGNLLLVGGFCDVYIEIKIIYLDNCELVCCKMMIVFWEQLLLLVVDQLLQVGLVDEDIVEGMCCEFCLVQNDLNVVFFYLFVQGCVMVY